MLELDTRERIVFAIADTSWGGHWLLPVLLASMLGCVLSAAAGFAQEPESAEAAAEEPAEAVTIQLIEEQLGRLAENTELDDAAKAELKEVFAKAKAELVKAAENQSEASRYKSAIENAADNLAAAGDEKESLEGYDFGASQIQSLNVLSSDRSALELELSEAKKRLQRTQAEPQRRVERAAKIPEDLAKTQAELAKSDLALKAVEAEEDDTPKARAARMLLQAQREVIKSLIKRLENERGAYEAEGELPRLRSDNLTARVKQLQQDIRELVSIITERRKTDAEEQKISAETAYEATVDSLKPFAQANIDLAHRRLLLAEDIQTASATRDQTSHLLTRWNEDFDRTRKRIDGLGPKAMGPTLVEKRSTLPSVSALEREIADAESRLRTSQTELYQLEDRRGDLSDINAAIAEAKQRLRDDLVTWPEDVNAQLDEIFQVEVQLLDSLLKDANRYYALLINSRQDRQELIRLATEYQAYIDRNIFWVPTASPLTLSQVPDAIRAFFWLFNYQTLVAAGGRMLSRFSRDPILVVVMISAIGLLFLFRVPMRRKLEELGETAARVSCRTMLPTWRALFLTVTLAVTWPLVLWFLGWMLDGSNAAQIRALSHAFDQSALWLTTIEFIRQLWRPLGLADAHFGWPTRSQLMLRHTLRQLVGLGIPLVFIGIGIHRYGTLEFRDSLSRFCLIGVLLLITLALLQSFWRYAMQDAESSGSRQGKISKFWMLIAILFPLGLVVLSIVGLQYAAFALTLDALYTVSLVLGLCVLQAMSFRWVRIARRKIRWQQLIEAQQHRSDSDEAGAIGDIAALVAKEEETDLVAMDRQSRRLISLVFITIGAVAITVIWGEVFPALSPILEHSINPFRAVTGSDDGISVGAMLSALIVICLSIAAWRNIPGLIDAMLLGRIGIESSIRYAVTTLSQYVITIFGVIVACGALGMTWGQVQWLVAAMGVGLGFGLQEIVANFVCGVLLLFERPIRVGDTVTLGETTGVVVRIRSRATTIRNWDRQEVVIPNKELITTRITNWTLSDDLNRIVIQVGVAYGSDTERVRHLLRELISENENVIEDPKPLVTFEQFGDSTLNFIVRAYLDKMDDRMETIHQLHTTIHQRFHDEGIEISFPQRDLHLRSMDPSIQLRGDASEQTAAGEPTWSGAADQSAD